MALSEEQFEVFKEQLRNRKQQLGDEQYSQMLTALPQSQAASKPGVVAPASPEDSPLQAGGKAIANTPGSILKFGQNIFEAATNPVQTATGVVNALIGGGSEARDFTAQQINNLTKTDIGTRFLGQGTNPQAEATFDALKQSLKDRYGSLEAAQKTATEDPFGVGADIVGLFAGSQILNKVDDINNLSKTFLQQKISGKVDDIAVGQMQKAINLNPTDIRRIRQPNYAGKDPAEWLLERGFKGSQDQLVNRLDDYSSLTKSQVDNGLDKLTTRVTIENATPALKTLDVLIDDLKGVVGMEEKLAELTKLRGQSSFSVAELNEIKRLGDNLSNIYKTTGAVKDSAKAQGLANVRNELKTLIENEAAKQGFDNVKQLNKETQVSKEISDALKKRLDVESKLPTLGLRDAILGVGGFATGGLGGALGVVITKKVLESPAFRTYLANKLKQLTPTETSALNEAIATRKYTEVIQYLAPVVNEFETSQKQVPERE